MHIRTSRFVCKASIIAVLFAFAFGCGDDDMLTDGGVSMDGGDPIDGGFDAAPLDASLAPCAEFPEEISLSQGGFAAMQIDLAEGAGVSASEGLQWSPEGLLANVDAPASGELRAEGEGCETVSAPVEVRPLSWTTLDEEAEAPAREYGAWWVGDYQSARGLYLLSGFHYVPRQFTPASDLWFYDLGENTWTEIAEETDVLPGLRYAPGPREGEGLLLGGATLDASGLDTPRSLKRIRFGDEVLLEDAPHAETTPGSYTGALIYDAGRERWLSICGADTIALGIHCRVLEYTESDGWRQLPAIGAEDENDTPPGRMGFHYAFDAESDRIVIAAGQSAGEAVLGDTWTLDLSQDPAVWTQWSGEESRIRRRNGAYAWDPVGRRMIMIGGTPDGRVSARGVSMFRMVEGHEGWMHTDLPDEITSRTSGFLVYDEVEEQVLFGYGNSDRVYADLHALSL